MQIFQTTRTEIEKKVGRDDGDGEKVELWMRTEVKSTLIAPKGIYLTHG